jgi:hypothetical protein
MYVFLVRTYGSHGFVSKNMRGNEMFYEEKAMVGMSTIVQ